MLDIVKPTLSDCVLSSNDGYAISDGAKLTTAEPPFARLAAADATGAAVLCRTAVLGDELSVADAAALLGLDGARVATVLALSRRSVSVMIRPFSSSTRSIFIKEFHHRDTESTE